MPPRTVAPPDELDAIFDALAAKPRREIVRLLASGAGADDERCCSTDEVCACVFSEKLGLSSPTVSHHMKALIDAGIITSRKQGRWVYYRLDQQTLARFIAELTQMAGCGAESC